MDLEDKVMAMEFAFMALAKALQEQGALPIGTLHTHLTMACEQLGRSGELRPVAVQLCSLRDALLQL